MMIPGKANLPPGPGHTPQTEFTAGFIVLWSKIISLSESNKEVPLVEQGGEGGQ